MSLATLGWGGVLAFHVYQVRRDLLAAKSAAASLHKDLGRADVSGSLDEVALLQKDAAAANRGSGGRVWSASSHLPLLGTQLTGVRTLSLTIAQLTNQGLEPAAGALTNLQQHPPVRQRCSSTWRRSPRCARC